MRNLIGLLIVGSIIVSVWFIFSTRVESATPAQCRNSCLANLLPCERNIFRLQGHAYQSAHEQCQDHYEKCLDRCG